MLAPRNGVDGKGLDGRCWMGRGCEIALIDLNHTYVVAKLKLAKCFVEKVGQGQRLCNCVNS